MLQTLYFRKWENVKLREQINCCNIDLENKCEQSTFLTKLEKYQFDNVILTNKTINDFHNPNKHKWQVF